MSAIGAIPPNGFLPSAPRKRRSEFFFTIVCVRDAGVTAATTSRMERDEEVFRLARGLYQPSGAPLDGNHSLAELAKRVPRGVVCLVSALAFHGLTDQLS